MAPCEYCEAGEHWRCNMSVHCSCYCNPEDPSTYMHDPDPTGELSGPLPESEE